MTSSLADCALATAAVAVFLAATSFIALLGCAAVWGPLSPAVACAGAAGGVFLVVSMGATTLAFVADLLLDVLGRGE